MSPHPAASQLCPPLMPRSSWEVLVAGPGSPLVKEELGRVQPRLRGSAGSWGPGSAPHLTPPSP